MVQARCDCHRCGEDQAFLRAATRPEALSRRKAPVTAVDLFAGCGGLSCGLEEAARRVGRRLDVRLAVDADPGIAAIYKRNFDSAHVVAADVAHLFPGEPGDELHAEESRLAMLAGRPDVLLAGPPCQGHSDLNNHTRRHDPKNALYLKVARAAEVLRPGVAIVENVPAVQHDRSDVVSATIGAFEKLEYVVDARVVDLALVGVPQHRRRFVLLASRLDEVDPTVQLDRIASTWGEHAVRTIDWAMRDLESIAPSDVMDEAARRSTENQRRIDYLFEHGVYDLPDSERPACHRDKEHSYRSVYGRLRWNAPSQTVTTGFGSMGQGRYVHPSKRRTLTPREAARLQAFPDWFEWGTKRRTLLSTTIGNAVPPFLTMTLGTAILDALGRGGASS